MCKPRYRFSPTLLQKFDEYMMAERVYNEIYGRSDDPSVSIEEFEEKSENELWYAINRVPQIPSEAAARGTLLNVIIDCKVRWEKPDGKYKISRIDDERGRMTAIRGECDGYPFEFSRELLVNLWSYFSGSICQYRTEATIDTSFGDIILYGDVDYIKRDKVYDLKTTMNYKYGKFDNGFQKDLYPYCLIESGMMDSISQFEYTVVLLDKKTPISGEIYKEQTDYSHERAKVRLRAVSEALAAYLEMNAERIEHPSRVLNEI